MRVPSVLDTGQYAATLERQLDSQRWRIDPMKVTVWGLIAAAVSAHWVVLVWAVIALMNAATVS
jgi:hypothetical protein